MPTTTRRRSWREANDDDEVVRDGQVLRVPIFMQDTMRREIAHHAAAFDGEAFDAALHRPGFRVASDAVEGRREQARGAWIRDTENRWRSLQRVEQDTEVAVEKARDAVFARDDAQRVRDAAYRSYVERITNAWKGGAA